MDPDVDQTPDLGHSRYTLGSLLGQGGAAEVWSAWDQDLAVSRAIKVLTLEGSQRRTLRRRLRAEARALASLDHPHVLRVLEMGTTRAGRDYLVMDLLEGGSLHDVVLQTGPLAPRDAIARMLEVLSALAAAHGQGIVHRDVKPQNILLARDGRAVLADFGIALVAEGDRRTRTGVTMGSFAFMPPEQRLDAKGVGVPADLYAVGASLYWLLTGRSPVDLFVEDVDGPRLSQLSPELARVIGWATQALPEDRPQSAAALAERLAALAPDRASAPHAIEPTRFPAPAVSITSGLDRVSEPDGNPPGQETWPLGAGSPAETPSGPRPTIVPLVPSLGRRWSGPLVLGMALLLFASGVGGLLVLLMPEPEAVVVDTVPPVTARPPSPGAVIPAPPLEPPRKALPAPPAPAITGRWSGSFDGRPASLRLEGPPDTLRGTFQVRFAGNAVDSRIRGRWEDGRDRLILEDLADGADAGRYEARRVDERLEGTFRGRYRDVVIPFTLTLERR